MLQTVIDYKQRQVYIFDELTSLIRYFSLLQVHNIINNHKILHLTHHI